MLRSSVRRERAAERASDNALRNQQSRDMAAQFEFAGRSAGNMGEAMKSVENELGRMNFLEKLRGAKDFDPKKGQADNFRNALAQGFFDAQRDFVPDAEGNMTRMADEQSKTPEERRREEQQNQDGGEGRGSGGDSGILSSIQSTLESFKASMEERLPQAVLGA
jgi:hypothetical protein